MRGRDHANVVQEQQSGIGTADVLNGLGMDDLGLSAQIFFSEVSANGIVNGIGVSGGYGLGIGASNMTTLTGVFGLN